MRQGPKSLADREARAFLATQVAEVMQAGRGRGITKALASLYDCSARTLRNLAAEGRKHLNLPPYS